MNEAQQLLVAERIKELLTKNAALEQRLEINEKAYEESYMLVVAQANMINWMMRIQADTVKRLNAFFYSTSPEEDECTCKGVGSKCASCIERDIWLNAFEEASVQCEEESSMLEK